MNGEDTQTASLADRATGTRVSHSRNWQLMAIGLVLAGLVYLLAPVLTPFAIAALLAYLGDPLVDRLQGRRVSRTLAVVLVFGLMILGFVAAVLLLVPMIESQISRLVERLPAYLAWAQEVALPWLEARSGLAVADFDPSRIVELIKGSWQEAGGFAATILGGLSRSGFTILLWLTNLLLIPVVTFYLLRDWDGLVQRVRDLLPRSIEPVVSQLAHQSDTVLSAFLRGQLLVMISLGAIYSIGLSLVGIELALLIGMLAGLVSFIPYLGAIVGVSAGLIAALLQFGDWWHVALVLAVFGAGQAIESFVLTPWLVGDRIGLHPVAVIFSIMAGGHLFGFLGVLLALPVAAVVMVVLRHAHEQYTGSDLYRQSEAPAGGRTPTGGGE